MSEKIRIVFMGTPEFAVASLQHILKSKISVAGIITAPDKPAGRGKQLQMPAVKEFAISAGLEHLVLQPANLKEPEFLQTLQKIQADLFVVVAFRMLPEVVWSMPRLGTINLHASLLPQYRGAAPINWVLINGEKKTGVTTFFIEKDIDTGNLIRQETVAIDPNETAGSLHDKLMNIGAEVLVQTIHSIEDGFFESSPQKNLSTDKALKSAPKLFKENCHINWEQPGEKIRNFIRGLSPYPAAWTQLCGKDGSLTDMKIFSARFIPEDIKEKFGSLKYGANNLQVSCIDGWLEITELQLAGKKRMATADFLRGFTDKDSFGSVS